MVRSLMAGGGGVSHSCHWKSSLLAPCGPVPLCPPHLPCPSSPAGFLHRGPLGVGHPQPPGGRPPRSSFVSQPPAGLPVRPPHPPHRPPPLASPLTVGADAHMPEMALLKMTFNQSWNYHADGCEPGNQSGAAGRAWQGPRASPGRQLLAGPPYKTLQSTEVLKASAPPFIRLTNNT